ncbi:hypothetical protein [Streptomyces griseofuscus]|uniref:hypothetical protein n=1 Tax=Streptomyces griseofuscus TaxID=146922 RepID=UPI003453AFD1
MNEGDLNANAVVVAVLFVHQISRTWEGGLSGLRHNYAPVFGVHMTGWTTATCQILALPLALTAALWDSTMWVRGASVLLVVLWMLSVQRRLANHAWLGIVSSVAFAFTPAHTDPVIARDLLAGVYLSAALFKLNGEYLFSSRSAGRVVLAFYFGQLGLSPARFQLRWLPAGVILSEFAAGSLLLIPHGVLPALVIAVVMHAVFGVSGNFPFSITALALWTLVMSPRAGYLVLPMAHDVAWWTVPLFAVLAVTLGRTSPGARPPGLLAKDTFLGVVYGVLCASALGRPEPTFPGGSWATTVNWLIGAMFLLNAGLVMAGVKLEWSFAMFSSLRPFGRSWLQCGVRREWPRYYLLTLPDRIPKALLKSVPAEFLYQSTRGTHVVHEAVAHRLENLAGKHGLTFQPKQVELNGESSALVPKPMQSGPRRAILLFPAIIPKEFSRGHLG